jgi:hypothetical protein
VKPRALIVADIAATPGGATLAGLQVIEDRLPGKMDAPVIETATRRSAGLGGTKICAA